MSISFNTNSAEREIKKSTEYAKIAYFRPYLHVKFGTFIISLGKIFEDQLFVDKIIQNSLFLPKFCLILNFLRLFFVFWSIFNTFYMDIPLKKSGVLAGMKMTAKILEKNQCAMWVNRPRWTQLQLDLRKKCQYETP